MKLSWRKITIFVACVALVVYLAVMFIFASSKEEETLCSRINVQITNGDELGLVNASDVETIIKSSGEKVIGQRLSKVSVYKIEKLLRSKSFIRSANVYTTADGAMNVKVMQRVPVVRVHTPNRAFYMDSYGFVFPLSDSYTHYVPVVTGNVPLPSKMPLKGELPLGKESETLRKLIHFVAFLKDDDFWNAQIEQINILSNAEVELIPRAGNHIIVLGKFDNYQYKLHKLLVFYKKAMPAEGWNKYSKLDLRFANQVVATLKK